TSSIIPQQSMGSIAFTRATPATVIDNEGRIVNVKSGEARFTGARRVQNLYTYSEDITNAVWNPVSCTSTKNAGIAPDGTNTAGLVTSAVAVTLTEFNQNYNIVSGQTYILSVSLKANGGLQYVQLVGNGATFGLGYINVDLSNGTITANVPGAANMQATVTPEDKGFYRIQFKATAIATIATNRLSVVMIPSGTSVRIALFPGDGIKGFYYWHPQFEDVTGQSVQTAGEYVSTNVLSSPFHGAMVDGVKYFDTTLAGDTISPTILKGYKVEGATTNLFTYSNTFSSWTKNFAGMTVTANQGTGPDGANSLWKVVPGVGSALQSLTLTTTVTAAVHTYTVYAKAGENGYLQLFTSGAISNGYINFDLFTGTIGASSLWTGSITPVSGLPGVYKCVAITNTLIATSNSIHLSQVPTNTTGRAGSMTGDGVSGLYVWGAQLELGSMSTSHLFTTGSTVTRNDDVLSYNVNNFNNKSGGVYAEVFTDWTGTVTSNVLQHPRIFGSSGGSLLYLGGTNALTNNDGGTAVSGMDITAGSTVQKVGLTYSATRNFFCNGVADTGKAYDGNMSITGLLIGNSSGGTRALYGNIRNVKIWKTPPTDAEMVSITS
ncbi:MAG TPA: hypothetical protein PLW93_02680, partial [Candidatus Absconditabacterales bacterium]|nr:hypothetical protein [Candidatus Absconditabacterales bacterium]